MTRSLVRFEYEKLQLHTIVYGGTGTGKTYFKIILRSAKRLHRSKPNQNRDQDLRSSFTDQAKNIIIVCKDDRDWIDPETGEFSIGFNTCDVNMITSKYRSKFKDSVTVLVYMDDKLNKDTAYYFTEERHYNIQMIVM